MPCSVEARGPLSCHPCASCCRFRCSPAWEGRVAPSLVLSESCMIPDLSAGVPTRMTFRAPEADARECEQITLAHARTFSLASKLLPAEKRRAAYALYAFCRIADDLVDQADVGQHAWRWPSSSTRTARSCRRRSTAAPADRSSAKWPGSPAAIEVSPAPLFELLDGVGRDLVVTHLRHVARARAATARASPARSVRCARTCSGCLRVPPCAPTPSSMRARWAPPCSSRTSCATSARMRSAGAATCRPKISRASGSRPNDVLDNRRAGPRHPRGGR